MWLHPLFRCQSSIPLAPPLPCLSESSNLLPPLVIYLHCSAIIQVIKTPADRSVFSLHESGSFQCVCETKPHPLFYVFVVGEYACVCIWPSVLRFVVDLDSNVLSFRLSTSLMLPSGILTISFSPPLSVSNYHRHSWIFRPLWTACNGLLLFALNREWPFHTRSTVSLVPVRVFTFSFSHQHKLSVCTSKTEKQAFRCMLMFT